VVSLVSFRGGVLAAIAVGAVGPVLAIALAAGLFDFAALDADTAV
jgi:hypothetical protein